MLFTRSMLCYLLYMQVYANMYTIISQCHLKLYEHVKFSLQTLIHALIIYKV